MRLRSHWLLLLVALLGLPALAQATQSLAARRVRAAPEALLDPAHAAWQSAEPLAVQVLPQRITRPWQMEPWQADLRVRALHNGKWLALRLEWKDPSRDARVAGGGFTDACAVQFPVSGSDQVSPFMGSAGQPVQILHWKAIWQDDVDRGYRDVEHAYPNYYYDYYPLAKGKAAGDIQGPALQYTAARYLENPIATVDRKEPAEEYVAEGFGTLTVQVHQDVRGRGVWAKGRWAVVLARPLVTKDGSDVQLTPGQTVPVAFALWDGAAGNRGARKHYTTWIPLTLEE